MSIFEIDPERIDGMSLPEEFTSTVFSPAELMKRLAITDESVFWLCVRNGRIPTPVWLDTEPPICVWDCEIIETWIKAGCPVEPTVLAHNVKVCGRLVKAVESEITTPRAEQN